MYIYIYLYIFMSVYICLCSKLYILEIFLFRFAASFFSINKYLQKRQLAQIIKTRSPVYI